MIPTLFKRGMVTGLRLMIPFALIMMMYGGVIVWMYDPALSDMLNKYQQLMPGLMAAVGMDGDTGTLLAFIHTYLYGFLFALIPFIFSAMLIHRQLIRPLDDGSFACILSSSHSRRTVSLTIFATSFILITIFMAFCAVFDLVVSEAMFPGELDYPLYWQLNLSCLLLQAALLSVVYFFSCVLQNQRLSLMLGAGIPLLMYLLNSMAGMGDSLRPLRFLTIFTLFPQDTAALQDGVLAPSLVLLGIAALLTAAGTIVFEKRDLSL